MCSDVLPEWKGVDAEQAQEIMEIIDLVRHRNKLPRELVASASLRV